MALDLSLTVRVLPAPTTALESAIAGLSVGTWLTFKLNAADQNTALGGGPSTGSILPYTGDVPWNPITNEIQIVGKDAGASSPHRYSVYDAATDAWIQKNALLIPLQSGHAQDHNVVNPTTGDLYFLPYNDRVWRVVAAGSSSVTSTITQYPYAVTVNSMCAWWTGSFTGAGVQGCLLMVNGGADGWTAGAFNPLTGTWFWNATNVVPGNLAANAYQGCMAYSAIHNCAVFGGTNAYPTQVVRVNSDRTFTMMPTAPNSLGINAGDCWVTDPITGNFLLIGAGRCWELNPTGSGTWTQQTGSRIPPSGFDPQYSAGVTLENAVAVIRQSGSATSAFYLYKHA